MYIFWHCWEYLNFFKGELYIWFISVWLKVQLLCLYCYFKKMKGGTEDKSFTNEIEENVYYRLFKWIKYCICNKKLYDNFFMLHYNPRLKNKIENNSICEGSFYQSEWVKINSSWIIFVFLLYVCCWKCIRIVLYGPKHVAFSKYLTLFIPF